MATPAINAPEVLTDLEILKLTLTAEPDTSGYIAGKQCIYNLK